jgi:hypothetical protein
MLLGVFQDFKGDSLTYFAMSQLIVQLIIEPISASVVRVLNSEKIKPIH